MRENKIWDSKYEDKSKIGEVCGFVVNSPTIKMIKKYAYYGSKILEVGCGTGQFSVALALFSMDYKISAVDFSVNSVESTKKLAKTVDVNINVIQADIENLPFKDGQFDIVFGDQVIGHTEDVNLALKEIYRVLSPGGYVVFNIPNLIRLDGWPLYQLIKSKELTYRHRNVLPITFLNLFKINGFEIVETFGEMFFFFRSWISLLNFLRSRKDKLSVFGKNMDKDNNFSSDSFLKKIKNKIEEIMPAWSKVNYGIVAKKI